MNQRIKELYTQTANETADGKEWAIGGLLNAERFADLIIKECIALVDDAVVHRVPASEYTGIINNHFNEKK